MDLMTAVGDIRQAIDALNGRVGTVQQNMVSFETRMTVHESVHDPYIAIIDGIRQQMASIGPHIETVKKAIVDQDTRITAVDPRITIITDQMSESGLNRDTPQRIAAVEVQMAGIVSHLAGPKY